MTQIDFPSGARIFLAELGRRSVMDVLRGAIFIGTLLLAWITLSPFTDLTAPQTFYKTEGGETATYASFGALAILALAIAAQNNMRGMATLLTRAFVVFGLWICLTVVLSLDPNT